ncbi:MAG TPA: leishmanolysin-related zinc metalloendopeptidase, partial [Gemmatimonadaceae bacterium]|nr:leishmanolysin-related zinc metalloendopeptidase [Gemmatimonadaceae bacterium]
TYTSSNGAVATTTAGGVVTASANTAGSTTIVATFGSAADTVQLTVDACGAGATGTYPIDLRNVGPALSAEVQAAFTCASARIRTLIRSGVSLVNFENNYITEPGCFGYTINGGTSTTGVIILMRVAAIDGAGGTLGRAGPCAVRSTSRLAVIGLMEFDEADLANLVSNGTLVEVILHEMLHVVGIGPTWRDPAFIPHLYSGEVEDPSFFGARAISECRTEHGGTTTCATRVPIEDCVGIPGCGSGTRYGHWRELVFDHELMTGYIDVPRSPLSRMTIAALADLGYSVDLDQAEDYMLPTPGLMAGFILEPKNLRLGTALPEPVRPTRSIDANGRARPILY